MSDIASVSIARPLSEVAAELGRSFEEYGFAVVFPFGFHSLVSKTMSRCAAVT